MNVAVESTGGGGWALHQVCWKVDGGDEGMIDFAQNGGLPEAGSDDRLDLAVLAEIYESANGFQDNDGTSVAPGVQGLPGSNTGTLRIELHVILALPNTGTINEPVFGDPR